MSEVLADDRTVIQRLLNHIDHKTTDMSDGVWLEPVEHYTSQERFEAEICQVFRRTATPFCPSAALPEIGSYVARDAALTPIVAVRGQDNKVRAFRNACRHRGVQLVEGAGCKRALTCRYHAWTYGLDGQLRGVPHEHGFPGLDKTKHGLVPVTAVEKHGMVFVTQDAAGDEFDDDSTPDFFGPEWRLLATTEQEFDVNWKIFVEGLLEGYHIRSTHAETFYPRQYDNVTVVEFFGRNSRVSYPYRSIEKLRDVPPAKRKAVGTLTHLYHLFPNVSVATFPAHMTLAVLEPLAVDRTRLVTYTLSNRADDDVGVTRGRDFVTAGTAEDREMACAAQRGLAANANEAFTFGLFEGAIRHFHSNLAAMLATA
jgi:phenylpropionate dioxygenase-like ring-hydroxylating dioxygenase large terminal subunit